MRTADWVRRLAEYPAILSRLDHLHGLAADHSITWSAMALEARPVAFAAAWHKAPQQTLIVTTTHERSIQWHAKLILCGVSEDHVRLLPSGTSALFEDASPETVALSDRIGALRALTLDEPIIVITTPQAALERTLPREILERAFLELVKGEEVDLQEIVGTLKMLGYEPSEPVRIPGQYSIRGGILDIYGMGRDLPVRIELFGDQIDSIRKFDATTQRSIEPIPHFRLVPSRETLFEADSTSEFEEMLERSAHIEGAQLSAEAQSLLEETIASDALRLDRKVFFDRLDLYRPLLHPDSGCALDLMAEKSLVVLDEAFELESIATRSEQELGDALRARAERGEILSATANDFMLPPDRLGSSGRVWHFTHGEGGPDWMVPGERDEVGAESLISYRAQPEVLARALKQWADGGFTVVLGTDQPTRAKAVLAQVDLFPLEGVDVKPNEGEGAIILASGNLAGGFALEKEKFVLLTDQEIFGVGRLKLPSRKFNDGAPVTTVLDLKPGDYVVHINFGIGVFQGLTKRSVDGVEKEYLYIQYAAPDKLFVPADQLDRIQKYLNPGDADPKLNRLTGGEWQRAVGKAREEAREFARDLIKLYASRKQVQRVGYGPDTPWQAEMESTFPYVETPSQMQAIRDAKADLQLDYPMDRLVCGDVGFGKTEVAIRAAFKVAQAGRQVAILCPTTILSEQHFRNFEERLAPFPTRLALINRFKTAGERREILAGVSSGDVDILIGTHALLNAEVSFKDLGLVIIDEEQKFGVKQKEALKAMRTQVDVMTLSATPIPRTLSMALMDIRQMSLINDPIPGRLPIRTFVRPHSDEVIREAILREMSRGGQVYYVYNRVQGIYHIAERLKKLIPGARIGVGHGQMNEKELEPIMVGFIHGDIDILLSTTIVENGLDIANANTMIVDNADRLGLAQLYQLRGRVGRSDRQAYAYLMFQKAGSLSENATMRLEALQEFSSLGAGYSLAFRDLQIRGAGELIGAKQSGTMATVGYELFTQIIEEEVKFLKAHADGTPSLPSYRDPLEGLAPLPTIDLPIEALIPDRYIEDQSQRLYCYKSMMSCRDASELDATETEIEDRYGRPPEEVQRALSVMRLRVRARDLGIEKIDGNGGRLAVNFSPHLELSPRVFTLMTQRYRSCYVSKQQLIWPFSGDALDAVDQLLKTFQGVTEEIQAQREAMGLV